MKFLNNLEFCESVKPERWRLSLKMLMSLASYVIQGEKEDNTRVCKPIIHACGYHYSHSTTHSQLQNAGTQLKACLGEEMGLVSPSSWGHVSHRGVQHQVLQAGGLSQQAALTWRGHKRSSWIICHGSVHLRDHIHELQITAGK